MNWNNPLKPSRKKDDPLTEELKLFKKPKCVISKSTVRKVTESTHSNKDECIWLERWIEQLIRERSYPPQLKSDDFYSLLSKYFDTTVILEILQLVRNDYKKAFPLSNLTTDNEDEDDLSWLPAILRADPYAIIDLPPKFLDD